MKAKVLLNWFIDSFAEGRISTTGIDRIGIDDDPEFGGKKEFIETFFGVKTDLDIPTGDYLYIWVDCIGDESLKELRDLADKIYELDNDGTKIYLVRIED